MNSTTETLRPKILSDMQIFGENVLDEINYTEGYSITIFA